MSSSSLLLMLRRTTMTTAARGRHVPSSSLLSLSQSQRIVSSQHGGLAMSWHQHQRMSSTTRRYTSEEYDNHGDSGDRASSRWRLATLGSSLGLAAGLSWWWQQRNRTAYAAAKGREQVRASSTTLENYSGTHSCSTDAYYEPAPFDRSAGRCHRMESDSRVPAW